MEEEKKKPSKGITAKIDEVFDEGEKMRRETGAKTSVQQLKEAAIITGLTATSLGGLAVGDATYNYTHPKNDITPDKTHEAILTESPSHTTKSPQDFIKEFEAKNPQDKGHVGRVANERETPEKHR